MAETISKKEVTGIEKKERKILVTMEINIDLWILKHLQYFDII